MARVLVTGASGFIGWHVARALLERGDEVTCLVRKTSSLDRLQPLGVTLVYGDITDPASLRPAIRDQQIVYHAAGRISSLRLDGYDRVNRQGTSHVAAVCAEQTTPPVLVAVSSLAAVGPSHDGRPRVATDRLHPVSFYGRSKRAGELAARRFADRVPITIVRPPIVFGEADSLVIDVFRPLARFGVHVVPGLARHRFSVIHAADLAHLLILAAERGSRLQPHNVDGNGSSQGYYFAACEQDPTYADFGRMIGEALGRRRTAVIPLATPLVWLMASAAELASRVRGRPLSFNLDKAREATAGAWTGSAQAAIEELGFRVGATLPTRLHQTAQWYRREGWI